MEFLKHTEWPMWFGYAAVASSIVTCAMKTMIPLRVVSMTCNALFIVYGFFSGIYPTLILNLILLPLNTVRLQQMRKLIQDVEAAASYGETSMDWLKPFMARRGFRKGDIVFHKGDLADAMYYSVSGRYRLREMGIELPTGQVFVDSRVLASETDDHTYRFGMTNHVEAKHCRVALIGFEDRGQDPHGGGLARPVGPEQAEDGAGRHLQVDTLESDDRPEALGEPLDGDDVVRHGADLRASP